jgi:predicted AlkP superfamily pyrophosphatase or phosphodiesterase
MMSSMRVLSGRNYQNAQNVLQFQGNCADDGCGSAAFSVPWVHMKRSSSLLLLLLLFALADAAPRLIVVVNLDQCRYDYLVRFRDHFGRGGFRRLIDGGANFTSATFKHANNVTGPGHAVLLSGSYGWANGIITNSWFDRTTGRSVYCVDDPSARPVGGGSGGRSPVRMAGGTFGDQLRIHSGFKGHVISISHKDRAAILMGGKMPDAAYWMADSVFVSSTYYMSTLPSWVEAFNRSGAAQSYFGRIWDRALPVEAYALMDSDDVRYEWGGAGLGRAFPHPITGDNPHGLTQSYYQAMLTSPFGLDLLAQFAVMAVDSEHLGADDVTDLLCVSFSSTDYVGHAFGPNSQEVMDMTVQADRVLAGLLDAIDRRVGLANTIVVLTSDHGVSPIPEYLQREAPALGARRISSGRLREFCERTMSGMYGAPPTGSTWVLRLGHGTVYLDDVLLRKNHLERNAAAQRLADSLAQWPGVAFATSVHDLLSTAGGPPLREKFRRSLYPGRTGDLVFAFQPFIVMDDGTEGADHGAPYDLDAHVPLIFFGPGVRPGTYTGDVSPVDLAPTLSALTGIEFPPGRDGRVLSEAIAFP